MALASSFFTKPWRGGGRGRATPSVKGSTSAISSRVGTPHQRRMGAQHYHQWLQNHLFSSTQEHPPPQQHHSYSKQQTEAIEQEILALLQKQAIEEATSNGFTSTLFTIPRKTGDLRSVLNLRPLN
ncbi:hypothetical protein BGX26_001081 [Mortierella sp. AD094]|nr:hypothetical protein BGX26_001081 [Mortierella sp. AD094]